MSRDDALEDAETVYERRARPNEPAPGRGAPAVVVAEEEESDRTVNRPLNRPAAVGDVIADKYRLVRTLGRGGMGRIFAADHLMLGTKVALKFMHPHLARDRGQVSRFAREARAAATLKSEHVARIIDVDHTANGELYIVMEYLEGASLETMAVDGRGLPVADAVTYLTQACEALAEAHARSIIHRDVKPANLFLTKGKSGEPVIKVLDFGLAKSLASSDGFSLSTSPTAGGVALGTPYYMSPEQITGAAVIDGRSDVWAIGATLYELLTGRLAFPGGNAAVVFDHILKARPTSIRVHRPDVPESIVAIVDRCLTADLGARFQTVRDVSKALEGTLTVATDPLPFVAAPLSTDRFSRSSAPPSVPPPTLEPSVRGRALSLANLPGLHPEAPVIVQGPTLRQTILAALAGPLLIVIVVGVIAIMMQKPDPAAASSKDQEASKAVYLSAKSAGATRAKAPASPEKPERSRR